MIIPCSPENEAARQAFRRRYFHLACPDPGNKRDPKHGPECFVIVDRNKPKVNVDAELKRRREASAAPKKGK